METIHKTIGLDILFLDKQQRNKLEMDKQTFMLLVTYIQWKLLIKIQMMPKLNRWWRQKNPCLIQWVCTSTMMEFQEQQSNM